MYWNAICILDLALCQIDIYVVHLVRCNSEKYSYNCALERKHSLKCILIYMYAFDGMIHSLTISIMHYVNLFACLLLVHFQIVIFRLDSLALTLFAFGSKRVYVLTLCLQLANKTRCVIYIIDFATQVRKNEWDGNWKHFLPRQFIAKCDFFFFHYLCSTKILDHFMVKKYFLFIILFQTWCTFSKTFQMATLQVH